MEKSEKLSIEKAWEKLFKEHDIVEKVHKNGEFRISSYQINKLKEARLMAKFDQTAQLPAVFRENGLSILPITRGEYLIGNFKTHENIEYANVKPKFVEIPDLQTINHQNLYSESSALLFAFNSGIIQDIMETSKINYTVNGRMSSGEFDFYIFNPKCLENKQHIHVQNAQVEIDAGYESPDAFCICEAKNVYVQELMIRQLFYPYRLWKNKIEKTKTELRKVRIFAFDYQTPELYYYDTQIKVTDNALVKALTNELQHNLPEDRFLTLTDEVGVTSAKLDKENGILTVVFNEAFTEKMLLGSVTESGLLASILSTYAYNYGVDKVAIYFGDKLYTSLRGELPEGYFKVDYSDAKPLYN